MAAAPRPAAPPALLAARVAVATRGDGRIDQHFGHARELLVYEVSDVGLRALALRRVVAYCQGGDGDDDAREATFRALQDCRAVFAARIGHGPRARLEAAGIEPVVEYAFQPVETAILAWFRAHAERAARDEVASAGGTANGPPGGEPEVA